MLPKTVNQRSVPLAFLLIAMSASAGLGQDRLFRVDYTVEIATPGASVFHVTADVKNIDQARLDLSLPTWTPGWYKTENYARNMTRFRITDAKGLPLPHAMTRKQTWTVDTREQGRIRIEFDYRADSPMVNHARITKGFAFFTGTQMFLLAEGHRASQSTVRFKLPAGWKIISALAESPELLTFTAPDYDTLVDAPTLMGSFDVSRFEVEGKPHFFVATPAGEFSSSKTEKFMDVLAKIAAVQGAIFGGLPYDKYVYFYFFWPPGATQQGYFEHSNSQVLFLPPSGALEVDDRMSWSAAHEFFHLWNVKRIRPVEMWPYDYAQEQETPLLWVSEGFSSYYADMTIYRAGLIDRRMFLTRASQTIREVEKDEARAYVSPAESSVAAWLAYGSTVTFGGDCYVQGQNLAALLDLSIRHDTDGKASLDDVMRGLYRDFYQRGRGFSTEDMVGIVNRLTGRDYHDFYRRFVWGVEVPPYDEIYGYAGYRVQKTTRRMPDVGFSRRLAGRAVSVTAIEPGSPAAEAGLLVGDIITGLNDQGPDRGSLMTRLRSNDLVGQDIRLTIKRAGKDREIEFKISGSLEIENWSVEDLPGATADQLRIREGWLSVSGRSQPNRD